MSAMPGIWYRVVACPDVLDATYRQCNGGKCGESRVNPHPPEREKEAERAGEACHALDHHTCVEDHGVLRPVRPQFARRVSQNAKAGIERSGQSLDAVVDQRHRDPTPEQPQGRLLCHRLPLWRVGEPANDRSTAPGRAGPVPQRARPWRESASRSVALRRRTTPLTWRGRTGEL